MLPLSSERYHLETRHANLKGDLLQNQMEKNDVKHLSAMEFICFHHVGPLIGWLPVDELIEALSAYYKADWPQHISQQKQSDADNGGQANQGNLFLCVTQDLCISSEISRRSCREAGAGGDKAFIHGASPRVLEPGR